MTAVRPPPLALDTMVPSRVERLEERARARSGSTSIVKVEEVGHDSDDEMADKSAYPNVNVEWVNQKGAWVMHIVLVCVGKLFIDAVPGVNQQMSWTMVNLLYISVTYLIFHWATGVPFHNEMHGGAYDNLTLWEQIDDGAQYTPAKKWLISVPIMLFLVSTHYTHYNPWIFAINITALVIDLVPKLPQLHRHRVRFMPETTTQSGAVTPWQDGQRTPVTPKSSTPISAASIQAILAQ